jgi:magnesium transporter
MLRLLYLSPDGAVRTDLGLEDIAAALKQPGAQLWIDLEDEPTPVCEAIMRQAFDFHPLAVEDALQESHVPKVNDWETYLYIVLHEAAPFQEGQLELAVIELDLFVGSTYLVTHHLQPVGAVDRVWSICQRDERHLKKGPTHLLYTLADEMVADYLLVVEGLSEAIELIEESIFSAPLPSHLEQISALKRALLRLRRSIAPQREVLNKLARGDYAVIDASNRVFFRDVYDHLFRLDYLTETQRDLLSSAQEIYLSAVNNRMNDVVKTLTVITTLFMPVSFLAGFFGMNFFQATLPFDFWTGWTAFWIMMAAMILLPLALFIWIRRRAWM